MEAMYARSRLLPVNALRSGDHGLLSRVPPLPLGGGTTTPSESKGRGDTALRVRVVQREYLGVNAAAVLLSFSHRSV